MSVDRLFNRSYLSVAALATATLMLESTLTRFLAVAQFYHFAFLVISLALLGFGASGSILFLLPMNQKQRQSSEMEDETGDDGYLVFAGVGFAVSVAIAYVIINLLPFDSYSIAWEKKQISYFILYYLALTLPFLSAGFGIGASLSASGKETHLVYAANLFGSGMGALIAPLGMWLAGVPGGILLSGLVGLLPAILAPAQFIKPSIRIRNIVVLPWRMGSFLILGFGFIGFILLTVNNWGDQAILGMAISPYKGLAQAKLYPGSQIIYGKWNAISRLDVISNAGTRMLPGLSYTYPDNPPLQNGLSQDAEASQPISLVSPDLFKAGDYLPEALAFKLRPDANTLALEPSGGLGVLQALSGGSSEVTAVISNPLIVHALERTNPGNNVYLDPRLKLITETARVFTRKDKSYYDIIFQPLTESYRPVTSGAYSLTEFYDLTVEAFSSILAHLTPDGLYVTTRWLQTPPSESLRVVTTLIDALKSNGISDPAESIVAYRGIQTMTILVRLDQWSEAELQEIKRFSEDRRYDLVWMPNINLEQTNRYNVLPEPVYYESIKALLNPLTGEAFIDNYPFAISSATDDKPFFFNFFTWKQTPELLATLGHTWQPFGGSGYFLLLALLGFVIVFSVILIGVPLLLSHWQEFWKNGSTRGHSGEKEKTKRRSVNKLRVILFFGLLGLAFLFVEIPLIQRWILLLGHPTYAFTIVVLALLSFSGIGSMVTRSEWLPVRWAFGLLVLLTMITPWSMLPLADQILGWSFLGRAVMAGLSLAPLGILMGLPFPLGLSWLELQAPHLISWAWAINGCASVISAVLAAILSLSYGFTIVLLLGAVAYAGAFIVLPFNSSFNEYQLAEQNGPVRGWSH